jgi:hypothetical protein
MGRAAGMACRSGGRLVNLGRAIPPCCEAIQAVRLATTAGWWCRGPSRCRSRASCGRQASPDRGGSCQFRRRSSSRRRTFRAGPGRGRARSGGSARAALRRWPAGPGLRGRRNTGSGTDADGAAPGQVRRDRYVPQPTVMALVISCIGHSPGSLVEAGWGRTSPAPRKRRGRATCHLASCPRPISRVRGCTSRSRRGGGLPSVRSSFHRPRTRSCPDCKYAAGR